jgi:hypothetical protein
MKDKVVRKNVDETSNQCDRTMRSDRLKARWSLRKTPNHPVLQNRIIRFAIKTTSTSSSQTNRHFWQLG